MKRALLVTYDPPPIPGWEQFAYHALLDGYDPGEPIGYGRTPRAAVRDLADQRSQIADRADPTEQRAELRRMRGME